MKKLIPLILFGLILAIGLPTGNAFEWKTDLNEAAAEAKANNRMLLLNFSGSDWCGWCKRLDAEVFSQEEFQAYANENLVPLLADFPRRGDQSDELKAQNRRLQDHFRIEGFPTLLLFNSDGEMIGRLGYQPGGPAAMIQSIQQVQARSNLQAKDASRPRLPVD